MSIARPGGRLSAPAIPYLVAHKDHLVTETAEALHDFDLAHAIMLTETGIVPQEIGTQMVAALSAVPRAEIVARRRAAGGGNHAGEKLLTALLGPDVGGYLGLARSSGDLSAVSIRSYLRASVLALAEGIVQLRAALLDFAAAHVETVMPGMTHGQHAQPTTLGHWALMLASALGRDDGRLAGLYDRVNLSPAGSGILSGSEFPVDRARVADLLGFAGVHENTMDAVLSHDIELEYAGCLLALTQTLARAADDLMLWSTHEHRGIELPDWFCGTSSLMPQKKNPDGLEDLKSLMAEALGVMATVASVERGPTGYPIIERRTSDAAVRGLTERLVIRLPVIAQLLPALIVDRARLATLTAANWSQASDLAALLVRKARIDWRRAHQLVGALIRTCVDRAIASAALTGTMLREQTGLEGITDADLADALDPLACVRRRVGAGTPNPDEVVRSIERARALHAAAAKVWAGRSVALRRAQSDLEAAAMAIIARG